MEFGRILTEKEARELNTLTLAYVGDAVHSIFVRRRLVLKGDFKAGDLHKIASQIVNAGAQASLADKLADKFTEAERDVFIRGRNGKSHHKAKNQSGSDYRKATGLEAVLGYLYLTGNVGRITELLGEENED